MTTLIPLPNRAGATSRTCWLCGHGFRSWISPTATYASVSCVIGWCRACHRTWEVRG